MLTYTEKRAIDILATVWMVEEQITRNMLYSKCGIPLQYNSNGELEVI